MLCRPFQYLLAAGAMVVLLCGSDAARAEPHVSFRQDIAPILSANCFACHGPDEGNREADLRLDTADGATVDLGGYQALAPGSPEESELLRRLETDDPDERMPPPESNKTLSDVQIATVRRWIAEGGKYERHWSFDAPQRPALPKVRKTGWPRGAIDRFVLARMEAAGLAPSEPAQPARLLRRVYLDLIGLPPTPEQIDAFLADRSADAYEEVVDALLASPRFGEKWARGWLDLARYADSNGYQRDGFRDVWAYRDWVIKALNADLPYDEQIIEQIAGDLLPDPTADQLIATGLHRQVTINLEAGTNPEADRVNQVMDRVNTTGTVFLGLTLECAQCHTHKFDPIAHRDYYRMFAYFNNTPRESKYRGNNAAIDFTDGPAVVVAGETEAAARRRELMEKFNALQANCADEPTPSQVKALKKLKKQIDAIDVDLTLVMQEMPTPRETHLLERGQWDHPGESVQPGVPDFLHPLPEDAPPNRLGLARWLAAPENPLTARVAVNRWWMEIFGRGIVTTPEDFGAQGARPTHPQLLDWLAVELVERDWSMKHLIRLIVTSATYRQSSRIAPAQLAADPENVWLARGPRFRLPAETIRDNALAIAGLLSDKQFGPPVFPPQPPGVWRVTGFVDNRYRTSKDENRYRRGIYTIWRRSAHYPSFANFDAPRRGTCVVQRRRTNTPLQALTLLNDEVYVEAAGALAEQVLTTQSDESRDEQIRYAVRRCVAREPRPEEQACLKTVLDERLAHYQTATLPPSATSAEHAAWTEMATILLNLDATITKD